MKKHDIGIDIGTTNIKIFFKNGNGDELLNMPTVIAVKKNTQKIIGIGKKAYNMLGKTPDSIVVKKTMSNGVVSDFYLNKLMLQEILSKILKKKFKKPRICLCIHSFMTNLEKLTFKNSIFPKEPNEIFLIEESLASGLGAGLNLCDNHEYVIVNIGGGTTDMSIISENGIINNRSIKTGAEQLDDIIYKNISKQYNLIIGEATAEKIKKKAATITNPSTTKKYTLNGKDKITGLPKSIEVTQKDICSKIEAPITKIVDNIEDVIKQTYPVIPQNLQKNGIILAGGGSLIPGVCEFISKNIGLKTTVVKNPINCAAFGALKYFKLLDKNPNNIMHTNDSI